jgi:hypothetical protein
LFAVGLIIVRWTTGQQRAEQGANGHHGLGNGLSPGSQGGDGRRADRYRWVALSNTTLSMTMATIDGSIVIIAMPAIFRGIHLTRRRRATSATFGG